MAVKGSATVTLTSYRDTQSVTRYYKLQTAGSSAPSKPTTKPPSSGWTDSEPDCDISKELYFCDLTIFSNGEWEYSSVSKSSSYEAAKEAYNRADNAQKSIDNLEIGGRNLLRLADWGRYRSSKWNENIINVTNDGYTFTATGDPSDLIGFKVPIESGVITISGKTGLVSQTIYFTVYDSSGDIVQAQRNSNITTENGRFVLTLTMPSGASELHIGFGYYPYSSAIGDYTVSNLKIEKGNKATDWTPAPEDVDAGIANAQTGVDSITETVFGEQTFNYILNGVTIPVYKREDGTYYYILNDEEVTVAESALVHDANGDLTSYQEGGIYEDLEIITGDIKAIDTKVNGFDAREDAIYASIEQNSLIARNYARFNNQSLIITNESETKSVKDLKSYLQLESDAINIYSNKTPAVAIGVINNSGYMEMRGTSLFIAQESRLSTVRLRSAEKNGKLALVAGSDGHVSLKEVLD